MKSKVTKWLWRAKGLMDDEAVFSKRDKIEGKMEYESFFFFFEWRNMRGGVWIMKYLFFIKIQCVSLYMVYEIVYLNFQVIFLTENTIFDRSSGQNCSQPIRLDSSIGSFGSLLTPSSFFFFFFLFFSPNFWVFTTVFLYFFYCLKSIQ